MFSAFIKSFYSNNVWLNKFERYFLRSTSVAALRGIWSLVVKQIKIQPTTNGSSALEFKKKKKSLHAGKNNYISIKIILKREK